LIPAADNFWLTLSAQAAFGNASLRRGYITGINTWDSSTGNADQNAWGVMLRLDWENALRFDSANVTPYLDVTYSKSKLDAYAESGGSFPASFEARTDKSTELRLGLNADYPLTGSLRLLGTVEAIHRFEKTSSNIRGQVPGIVSFDIVGQTNERNWERFGIGVEDKLAGGVASIYLNVTTKGEAPNAWLAASWKWAF
jgi:outer membrane autotransporter protein